MHYRIVFSSEARRHLRGLSAASRSLVVREIAEQLSHQPLIETRNRKPMRLNEVADWELRVRDMRVYYFVEEEEEPVVYIDAIGVKVRNRVFIEGEEADFHEKD